MTFIINAGKKVIEKCLQLYYATKRPQTPKWAKTLVYGALVYFISPIDVIPDFTPVIGLVDDLGILIFAVMTIAMYIDSEAKEKATEKLKCWFGD